MEINEIQSNDEFNKTIRKGVTLADFNAPWCAPCHTQEPILKKLADQFKGKVSVSSMNIDQNREVAIKLGIRNIPTIIIFKNSKEIERFVGVQSETVLSEALKSALE